MLVPRIFAVLSLFIFSQCASRGQVAQIQSDSEYAHSRIDSLRLEQRRLHQSISQLRTQLDNALQERRQLRAESREYQRQLADQVRVLGDRIDDLARYSLNKQAGQSQPSFTPQSGDSSDSQDDLSRLPDLCEAAYRDFVQGHYDLAREGFQQYLRLLPNGAFADHAQYGIADSYYANQEFDKALAAFQTIIEEYPKSAKVPAALLKVADCHIALGKENLGRASLHTLISRFPHSNEANLAQSRLAELAF